MDFPKKRRANLRKSKSQEGVYYLPSSFGLLSKIQAVHQNLDPNTPLPLDEVCEVMVRAFKDVIRDKDGKPFDNMATKEDIESLEMEQVNDILGELILGGDEDDDNDESESAE